MLLVLMIEVLMYTVIMGIFSPRKLRIVDLGWIYGITFAGMWSFHRLFGVFDLMVYLTLGFGVVYWRARDMKLASTLPVIAVAFSLTGNYGFAFVALWFFGTTLEEVLAADFWLFTRIFFSISFVFHIGLALFIKQVLFKRWGEIFERKLLKGLVAALSWLFVLGYYVVTFPLEYSAESHLLVMPLLMVFLLLAMVALMLVYRFESRNLQLETERALREQMQPYTQKLEAQSEEIRRILHDYTNIILSLNGYIEDRDLEKLAAYFQGKILPMHAQIQENSQQLSLLSRIKVPEVKGVVSSILTRALHLDINLHVEVMSDIESINMDMIPLVRIIGIILDNAIEEVVHDQVRDMSLVFVKNENSVVIILKNSCREPAKAMETLYQKGISTKGEGRGLGLANLRELVGAWENVYLSTQQADGYFVQELEIFE